MRKKMHAFLMMFVVSIVLLIGCGDSEQGNVKKPAQNQDVVTEHQIETESLKDSDTQQSETESLKDNDTQQTESESLHSNDTQKPESGQSSDDETQENEDEENAVLDEDGSYTSKEEVAAYLHQYGRLPSNFITKKEAKKLGWVSSEGNLGEVAPGKSIGGDYFGNYEGMLPEKEDRDYYECDINSDGSYRGAERIVFSNDGLIYYTPDHYDTFELLYGEE